MPKPIKGQKTPGSGRKPGTVNKTTETLREICAKHNVSVFEAMVMIASKEDDDHARFDMLERLLPYLEAKRTSVTHDIDPEKNQIRVIIERYK